MFHVLFSLKPIRNPMGLFLRYFRCMSGARICPFRNVLPPLQIDCNLVRGGCVQNTGQTWSRRSLAKVPRGRPGASPRKANASFLYLRKVPRGRTSPSPRELLRRVFIVLLFLFLSCLFCLVPSCLVWRRDLDVTRLDL